MLPLWLVCRCRQTQSNRGPNPRSQRSLSRLLHSPTCWGSSAEDHTVLPMMRLALPASSQDLSTSLLAFTSKQTWTILMQRRLLEPSSCLARRWHICCVAAQRRAKAWRHLAMQQHCGEASRQLRQSSAPGCKTAAAAGRARLHQKTAAGAYCSGICLWHLIFGVSTVCLPVNRALPHRSSCLFGVPPPAVYAGCSNVRRSTPCCVLQTLQ